MTKVDIRGAMVDRLLSRVRHIYIYRIDRDRGVTSAC